MASASRPNILFITSDQQHYDTIGKHNPRIKTPALDRLADEGTLFTRAYCPNPVCSPSRSSMITGMYPSLHHCWTIGVKLPEDVPTVGDVFQRNGYATSLIGKAHFQPLASVPGSESIECQPIMRDLEFWRNFHGPWYGFEHVETNRNHADESHCGQHYALWMEEKGLTNWRDYFQDWPPDPNRTRRQYSWDLPEEYHYSVWCAERSIAKLEEYAATDQPFFLWSSFMDPHPPYLVSEPWASMYNPDDMVPGTLREGELDAMPPQYKLTQEKHPDFSAWEETPYGNHGFGSHLVSDEKQRKDMAVYYGMISLMDREIGRIITALDRLGIADNTIVVFTTDHGHYLGQHGLNAKGAFHYDDLLRVPFIVRYPNHVPAGVENDALQSHVDLAPTFLSACGIDVPGIMQGVNQMDAWCNREPARDHVIVENRHQPTAVHIRVFIDERYKIAVYRNADYGELFDLRDDPEERFNRWDDPDYASIKSRLLLKFVQAEIQREPTRMPRIAGA